MQLSVEVKRQNESTLYICRGQLLNRCASEYLFDLLTRPGERDAVVDLAQITAVDETGLAVLALSDQVLAFSHRRLFLLNAPLEVARRLRTDYGAAVLEWPNPCTIPSAVTTKSTLAKQAFGGN